MGATPTFADNVPGSRSGIGHTFIGILPRKQFKQVIRFTAPLLSTVVTFSLNREDRSYQIPPTHHKSSRHQIERIFHVCGHTETEGVCIKYGGSLYGRARSQTGLPAPPIPVRRRVLLLVGFAIQLFNFFFGKRRSALGDGAGLHCQRRA
jgi:hypothetical protein